MFNQISLRARLLVLIAVLASVNLSGSFLTLWYGSQTQNRYKSLIDQNISALMAAQKLETALVMQKGLLTYYFLTSSSDWLEQLKDRENEFKQWLEKARNANFIKEAGPIINEIESRYIRYAFDRGEVIKLYKEGDREEGVKRHWEVRSQFFAIFDLAEKFKQIHEKSIEAQRNILRESARNVFLFVLAEIFGIVILTVVLTFTIIKQVMGPIREILLKTDNKKTHVQIGNEIKDLSRVVNDMAADIDQARLNLEKSREHLAQSEKLATVGKLAAGMAHSVRNPLTSVKMRMFSLERSLQLNAVQKDDLEVISEEIRHIDTILRNFLEFARPPKLLFQMVSPSDVIDMTIELLRHRFETYKTSIQVKRRERLPRIPADSDQLKEVLVNLMINACEAMGEGGTIRIFEELEQHEFFGDAIKIQIEDSGPGISEEILEKIFEPFFSIKEEGSGLGLSIARRIIEDHGGEILVASQEGKGATFCIVLPMKENIDG